ncbi:MAG TPA: hypothetical protein PLP23_11960 [Panacibacter sp.]|nr:hypothetical protein [Panacibacter sp.]
MSNYLLYNTADGKTIFIGYIHFIGPIQTLEDGLNEYKIFFQDKSHISVVHADEAILIKDRRKLELAWEKILMRTFRK